MWRSGLQGASEIEGVNGELERSGWEIRGERHRTDARRIDGMVRSCGNEGNHPLRELAYFWSRIRTELCTSFATALGVLGILSSTGAVPRRFGEHGHEILHGVGDVRGTRALREGGLYRGHPTVGVPNESSNVPFAECGG